MWLTTHYKFKPSTSRSIPFTSEMTPQMLKKIFSLTFAAVLLICVLYYAGESNQYGIKYVGLADVFNKDAPNFVQSRITTKPPQADNFNPIKVDDDDVFVLLHIQKTGGTVFEGHLVQNLKRRNPCVCRTPRACVCNTPKNTTWLISRFATGWPCGTHNDWTELDACLERKISQMKRAGRLSNNTR